MMSFSKKNTNEYEGNSNIDCKPRAVKPMSAHAGGGGGGLVLSQNLFMPEEIYTLAKSAHARSAPPPGQKEGQTKTIYSPPMPLLT